MNRGHVIILHGIADRAFRMQRLADAVQRLGYTVHNVDYPSTTATIPDLCHAYVKPVADKIIQENAQNIHFIGYSMGGLLVRECLRTMDMARVGQCIFLGTPHQGSRLADIFERFAWYRWFFGVAGQQLGEKAVPALNLPLSPLARSHCLAGTFSWDPISSCLLLPHKNDGKVTVRSASLPAPAHNITMPVSHLYMPYHPRVIQWVCGVLA